ncbi:MAG: phasin family protein [Hyphomicrobiales bacterium]|nr:phasin family protein [Hyphomicrobiales bacterium]
MFKGFEDFQKTGKENMDLALMSFGNLSKGVQAMTAEVADFSKKSFDDGAAALEKLVGVKSLDAAIEVQTDYFKSAYEGYMGQVTKMGELYADLAKEAYKPFEKILEKA